MKSYIEVVTKIEQALEAIKNVTLATANKDGIVSARSMALVNDGLTVYMQTDSKFDKVKDIKENPNTAISFAGYSLKGRAEIIGHPRNNKMFIEKLKQKHPKTYKSYTELSDEILIRINLTEVRIWGFESNDVHDNEIITVVDLIHKTVKQITCDKL